MSIIKYINEMLNVLSKNRSSVFIGVTAIMVAILVFIAGIFSNDKVLEVEKKALLNKLKLRRLLNLSVGVLIFSWFLELIENFWTENTWIIVLLFSLIEIVELGFIIYVSFRVCKVFSITIKMIKSIDMKNNEVKNYILGKCSEYVKYYRDFDNYTFKNTEGIKDLISRYKDLFQHQSFPREISNYDKVCFNQNGYIESIDIEKLESILQKLKDAKLENSYESNDNKRKVILTHYPGEKIKKDEVLFYISGDIDKALFYKLVIINSNKGLLEKEINDDFRDILAKAEMEVEFDQSNILKNFYKDLLELDEKTILDYMNNQIFADLNRKMKYEEVLTSKDIIKLQERLDFFLQLGHILVNDNVDYYLDINSFVHKICLKAILYTDKTKDFAYYYVNNIIDSSIFYCSYGDGDILYIDNLAYLFAMIINLLETNKFEEAKIIAKNLYIGNENKNKIYNFKFLMGLVKLYIVLLQRDMKNNDNVISENHEIFEDIYKLFESEVLNINEEINFNKLFINLLELPSDKIDVFTDFIEYDLLSDKYSSSYVGFAVTKQEVMFYIFLTIYNYLKNDNNIILNMDINLIEKMKSYLEYMNNSNVDSRLSKILSIDTNIVDLFKEEFILPLLNEVEKEEHKYISNIDIDKEINIVRKKLSNLLDIRKSMNFDYVNIKIIKSKSQKCLSKYNIFPIRYFKEILINNDRLESNYKNIFIDPLLDRMRQVLNEKAIKVEYSLEEYLKQLKNTNEFIIITDKYEYEKIKNYEINYNIKIYAALKIDYFKKGQIFIINKKDLPIIELHEIDEENGVIDKENIMKRYQYIEIKRLSERTQKDKIEVDGKELTEEEKKEYVYVRVLIAVDIKINNKNNIILFEDAD